MSSPYIVQESPLHRDARGALRHNNRSQWILVGSVLVLLLVGVAGYRVLGSYQSTAQTTDSSPTPTPTTASDWLSFANADFTVKHPSTWQARATSETQVTIEGNLASFVVNKGSFGLGLPYSYEPTKYQVTVDGQTVEAREWSSNSTTDFLIVFQVAHNAETFYFRLGGLVGVDRASAKKTLLTMLSTVRFLK